jgi:hypothetical protein
MFDILEFLSEFLPFKKLILPVSALFDPDESWRANSTIDKL